jgi:hypothetical protein
MALTRGFEGERYWVEHSIRLSFMIIKTLGFKVS